MQSKVNLLKTAAILFLVGIASTLLFSTLWEVKTLARFLYLSCFQGLVWVFLYMGNNQISIYLNRKYSWLDQTLTRLSVGIVAMVIYTIGSVTVFLLLWEMVVDGESWQGALQLLRLNFFVISLVITVFISMILHGRMFFLEWKASASEAERLKNENLVARFQTLKNQVNPHFLFNSFNVLSTLVYKDQDQAAKFIKEMSNLYRYVLETQEVETVLIEKEEIALKAFLYLSKMRFGENIDARLDLEDVKHLHIAPMTLQMLVENAIKHNIISKACPLQIEVFSENGEIIVTNNLQPKSSLTQSAGVGLPNIKARYRYLTDGEVKIERSKEQFKVRIPLLGYENNHN